MAETAIEWADYTFNPWWGCVKVSPGCKNCYAETWALRLLHDVWGPSAPRHFFSDTHWREPLRWDARAARDGSQPKVFCASMADAFEKRPDLDAPRARLWETIDQTANLIWLLLTKRPENVPTMLPQEIADKIWLGTSVEDQEQANVRIPQLVSIKAAKLFLSCEPLLELVDVRDYLPYLDWIIAGGESGREAREPTPEAFRSLRDQCIATSTAFFFKQWGEFAPLNPAAAHTNMKRVGKKRAGAILDGREWREFPA